MKAETIVLNKERNVTLKSYLLEVNGEFKNIHKRPAVLVLPGGGYHMCSEREAEPVALAYLNAGFHTFILNYSVGSHAKWPNPLSDYEQAMSMIRDHAEEWNLYPDKIAVIGFSAGGHLAASAATVAVNKPNAAILGYAVTEEKTAKMCLKSAPDVVSQVNGKTCPCFVFAARNDNVVPICNTTKFVDALAENGVIFENHIYGYGPHGFSTADASTMIPGTNICSRASRWVADSIAWLGDIWGEFGDGEMTPPRCIPETKGDHAPYLSIECTVGHLMKNAAAQVVLGPVMNEIQKNLVKEYGNENMTGQGETEGSLLENISLKTLLSAAKIPEEQIEYLDQELRKIPV